MLSKRISQALNEQMNQEFFSAYAYLAIAAHYEQQELPGFAHFFHIQSREELDHAMRIFHYIHKAGGRTALSPIKAPRQQFKSIVDPFKYGLKNERLLAGQIDELLDRAVAEKHAPTRIFLDWFVTEQMEEEALFTHCIRRIELVGKDNSGILLLDKEFAERADGKESA